MEFALIFFAVKLSDLKRDLFKLLFNWIEPDNNTCVVCFAQRTPSIDQKPKEVIA